MKNNKVYILFMIFLIVIISVLSKNIESFGFFDFDWVPLPPPLPFFDVAKIFTKIGNMGRDIRDLPHVIPNVAKDITDGVINIALLPPKTAVNVLKTAINKLQSDTTNLFKIVKDLFGKLKYFAELLMFTINRGRICSEGAERVLKNYTLQTNAILNKISIIHKKLEICPKSPFSNLGKYYTDCIRQIIPFIKSSYKYSQILMKFYKEVLTYEELFPQAPADIEFCKKGHKNLKTKKQLLEYANKCNYCLHVQSVLSLGLDEITEFAKTIKILVNKGKEIEKVFAKLKINI